MLILIMGLPNSGKTTYSQKFDNVLHLDDFPNSKFLNCNKEVSKRNGNIVVEGIYNLRCRRELLLKNVNGEKICIWIDTPLEECLRRSGRPKEVVQQDYNVFQPPTYEEGWDDIIRIKYNE